MTPDELRLKRPPPVPQRLQFNPAERVLGFFTPLREFPLLLFPASCFSHPVNRFGTRFRLECLPGFLFPIRSCFSYRGHSINSPSTGR